MFFLCWTLSKTLNQTWSRPGGAAAIITCWYFHLCCDDQHFQSLLLEWIFHFCFPFLQMDHNEWWKWWMVMWWSVMDSIWNLMDRLRWKNLLQQIWPFSARVAAKRWPDWNNEEKNLFFSFIFQVYKQVSSFVWPVCQNTSSLRAVHCWE